MLVKFGMLLLMYVALRKESVDRNACFASCGYVSRVALRKESVDRNAKIMNVLNGLRVALRKESVDRNYDKC